MKILFAAISALYTFLYIFFLDSDIILFNFLALFSKDGSVSGTMETAMSWVLFVILEIGVILLVIFNFKAIQGSFLYFYIPSLLVSFLLPLLFNSLNSGTWISLPWYFMAIVLLLFNMLAGPAMVFLASYFAMKFINK